MKIAIVIGTRPEIIKMSPIIATCLAKNLNFLIIHTKQHYSKKLDHVFFRELSLPHPHYNLQTRASTHGAQTSKMLFGIEQVLIKEKPDIVLVEGDTNTVLAGALAATKLHIKVAHVEAGLRSYYRQMPEEINRVLTDHCSDLLFAPTPEAKNILLREGIPPEKIFVTGNTIVDAVHRSLKLSDEKRILEKYNLTGKRYFLLTLHRQENVDEKDRLRDILYGLEKIMEKFDLPLIYPIHPRTRKMIKYFALKIPTKLQIINPIGYLDFLSLQNKAELVLTDSGGIQEEACILRVPCVTIRDNTERPETIEVGANILSGTNPAKILDSSIDMLKRPLNWQNPFGDGHASEKIVEILINKYLC